MSLGTVISRISDIESQIQTLTQQAVQATPATAQTSPAAVTTDASAQSAGQSTPVSFASALNAADQPQPAMSTSSSTGQRMVSVAESQYQAGATEEPPGSNAGPWVSQYASAVQGSSVPNQWCAYFASWVAAQAGSPLGAAGQGFGSVDDLRAWAQQTGRWVSNTAGTRPVPGDLIVFPQHVGVVASVDPDGTVHTVEGNYSNKVSAVTRGAGEAQGYITVG